MNNSVIKFKNVTKSLKHYLTSFDNGISTKSKILTNLVKLANLFKVKLYSDSEMRFLINTAESFAYNRAYKQFKVSGLYHTDLVNIINELTNVKREYIAKLKEFNKFDKGTSKKR